MKKLRLDLDQLTVETFEAAEHGGSGLGTVRGAQACSEGDSLRYCTEGKDDSVCGTCDFSCYGSCFRDGTTCTCPVTYVLDCH